MGMRLYLQLKGMYTRIGLGRWRRRRLQERIVLVENALHVRRHNAKRRVERVQRIPLLARHAVHLPILSPRLIRMKVDELLYVTLDKQLLVLFQYDKG